jgi:hypothetical protein
MVQNKIQLIYHYQFLFEHDLQLLANVNVFFVDNHVIYQQLYSVQVIFIVMHVSAIMLNDIIDVQHQIDR